MTKVYSSILGFFSFNVSINGKTRRIAFEQTSNGQSSLFVTNNEAVQKAIEQRRDFGTIIQLKEEIANEVEDKPIKTEENGANSGEEIVVESITSIQELREYLIKEKGVHHASLNKPENITKKATELNIVTPNLC